jgi:hypothetical protein
MVLRERPLFVIRKSHEDITDEDICAAFQELAPEKKKQFLLLRDNASSPYIHMEHAFAENSWLVSENPPIHGLCLLHSRFNHSCIPNSTVPSHSGEIVTSFATRDIAKGEEITFCYRTEFKCMTSQDRHEELRFICHCKACLPGSAFQQLSDMRRTLIRGLHYLSHGEDPIGQTRSPIIVDPKLRKAAEDFCISISDRLIYNLLTACLLEEEGLMDDYIAERWSRGLLQTAALFKTEANAKIARLAMAQETWLKKLCMAFRLYGQGDVADHDLTVNLRIAHGLPVTP